MSGRGPTVVFDIETIPDEHHIGDEFPKTLHHQVVAISFLEANLVTGADGPFFQLAELRSGGEVGFSEEQLVRGFFKYIEAKRPRLVTFNGRGFDLPVLKYRALKYGISAPWFARGESKWENYGQRYSVDWHCDLMDAMADFGASRASKLNELCELLGIPSKTGMDGSQVARAIAEARIADVRAYCEEDVVSTYKIFLRYALFRGEISSAGFEASVQNVDHHLAAGRLIV